MRKSVRVSPSPVHHPTETAPTKIDLSANLKDLTKEQLEQGIKECEDTLGIWMDANRETTPDEEFAKVFGFMTMPVVYIHYLAAKNEYIERYGTSEQKEAFKALSQMESLDPQEQRKVIELLEMPPYMLQILTTGKPGNHIKIDEQKIQESIEQMLIQQLSN